MKEVERHEGRSGKRTLRLDFHVKDGRRHEAKAALHARPGSPQLIGHRLSPPREEDKPSQKWKSYRG